MTFSIIIYNILVPLIAAAIGALLAFRFQYRIEIKREKRAVLQNLMMYRNAGAHELDWIKSLNAIDIVYHEHKKVRELYHTFIAQTQPSHFGNRQWVETFYQLIHEMGQCSDYKNLSLHDIRDFYAPEALSLHYPNMNVGTKPPPTSTENQN